MKISCRTRITFNFQLSTFNLISFQLSIFNFQLSTFLPFSLNMKNDRITPTYITCLKPNEVFVFGSNLAGFHGGGAAHIAHAKFGAIWGQGVGMQGQSYAIPTMQGGVETIKPFVDQFIDYARQNPIYRFYVTRIGCGIAGFTDEEIAPLFREAVDVENICLPTEWWDILDN